MISIRRLKNTKLFLATMILTMSALTQAVSATERHFHGPRISLGLGIGIGHFGYPYRNYYLSPYSPYQSVYYPEVMVSTDT